MGLSPPTQEVIDRFTYRKELINMNNEGLPWYKDYRYQSVALLLIALNYYLLW